MTMTRSQADYNDGYNEGLGEMKAVIADALSQPDTDDPLDTLRTIARLIEWEGDYDYFNDKGQWVLYPQDA